MPTGALSTRERDVLTLASEGLTSGEIAARLGLGRSTVETHVRSAMKKLGARTRAQAVFLVSPELANGFGGIDLPVGALSPGMSG